MNDDHGHDDGHEGLKADLEALARRRVLQMLAGAGLVPLFGCSDDTSSSSSSSSSSSTSSSSSSSGGSGSCSVIPEETAGPYPGDGSNGANTLTATGIVRSDITTSFGSYSGTAEGVPLTIELTLVNTSASCAPLAGYAFYLWHCDRDGDYSLYTVSDQNYLRGIQETDANGTVTFTSIFPACYSGRWPHIHFEIFPSLAKAAAVTNKVKTSQLAMPEDACHTVFATTGYESSVSNLKQVSLATDNVFSDGSSTQVGTVTGSVSEGFKVTLTVGIKA